MEASEEEEEKDEMGRPCNMHHPNEKCKGNSARKPAGYMEETWAGLSGLSIVTTGSIKANEFLD